MFGLTAFSKSNERRDETARRDFAVALIHAHGIEVLDAVRRPREIVAEARRRTSRRSHWAKRLLSQLTNISFDLFLSNAPERIWIYTVWFPVMFTIIHGVFDVAKARGFCLLIIASSITIFAVATAIRYPFRPGSVATDAMSVCVLVQACSHLTQRIVTVFRERNAAVLIEVQVRLDQLDQQQRVEAELRQTRRDLERLNRIASVDALTTSIVHEVSNPIGAALINSEMALRMANASPPNLEAAKDALKRSIRDADRAASVVERVRLLTRNSAGHVEDLEIKEVLDEALALVLFDLRSYDIAVDVQLPPVTAVFQFDRVKVLQVLLNLLNNAIEALREQEGERRLIVSAAVTSVNVV